LLLFIFLKFYHSYSYSLHFSPFLTFPHLTLESLPSPSLTMLGVLVELGLTLFQFHCQMFVSLLRTLFPSFIPKKDVSGKVALVTGAGQGLGALIAAKIASLGAKVILWDVNSANNEATAEKIRSAGGTAFPYTIDLSDEQQIEKLSRQVVHDVGSVDILVNNAGIITGKTFMETPTLLSKKVMEVNALAVMWTTKAFLADMLTRDEGHVVTVASAAGLFGANRMVDYCTSKFAVVGFMEALAVELHAEGKTGIHTTTVCPYMISTGMVDGVAGARWDWMFPMLEPEEVATAVVDAMRRNLDFVLMPKISWSFYLLKPWKPTKAGNVLADFVGLTTFMEGFKGRQKNE
jgi:all-trans-retinol dehydrogenase (NAD+)